MRDRISRLERLFGEIQRDDARDAEAQAVADSFRQVSAEDELIYQRCAAKAGSQRVLNIIRDPRCGDLRRALGDYCRKRRIVFPGAHLIRVRRGTSFVTFGGDGKLMQIMADMPMPSITMENQQ